MIQSIVISYHLSQWLSLTLSRFLYVLVISSQGVNAEVELVAGKRITITTNDEYKEKCDEDYIWVDYKNITQVLEVGKKIYIDDGLMSLIVREKG